MRGHWYLIANSENANFYTVDPSNHRFKLVASLKNPRGRDAAWITARRAPGRQVRSMGTLSSIHYSASSERSLQKESILQFARQIARFLELEGQLGRFRSLSVSADSNLLGALKSALKSKSKKLIKAWIPKNLAKAPIDKLSKLLGSKSRSFAWDSPYPWDSNES